MKKPQLIWTAAAAIITMAGSAAAHHGWSLYDESAPLTITGTVRELSYGSPHATLQLQAEGHESQVWRVVLAPPARMESEGLTRESIKAGTLLTATGYVHKQHATELRVERLTIAGKMTNLR